MTAPDGSVLATGGSGAGTALVKCVVWDLDGTVWDGTLSEDDDVVLRPGVAEVVAALDARGILQSVASRNEPAAALERLEAFGLLEYFLFPQVSWGDKSVALRTIAESLEIGLDTLLFVDDSPFERAEVTDALPEVRTADADAVAGLLGRPELSPVPTPEAAARRLMYRAESSRRAFEQTFPGPRETFLSSLDLRLAITHATEADVDRLVELAQRTNRLNSTGLTFTAGELSELLVSPRHTVLAASLRDRFGGYGTISLALLEEHPGEWLIRLFLMSCRVMGRNVGGAVLAYVSEEAHRRGLRLTADFRRSDVNKPMYTTYRLAGFGETGEADGLIRLRHLGEQPIPYPRYVQVALPPAEREPT